MKEKKSAKSDRLNCIFT